MVFGSVFLAGVAVFPPTVEDIYTAGIAGGIIFIASLRARFGVRTPPREPPPG